MYKTLWEYIIFPVLVNDRGLGLNNGNEVSERCLWCEENEMVRVMIKDLVCLVAKGEGMSNGVAVVVVKHSTLTENRQE